MKMLNLNWKKINPAEIDYIPAVCYFAFAKNNQVLHVEEALEINLFTQMLMSAIPKCLSIYEMEIWVGQVSNSTTEEVGRLPEQLRFLPERV